MPPSYPPPSSIHEGCALCSEHYYSTADQQRDDLNHRYDDSINDTTAKFLLDNVRLQTEQDLQDVKELVGTHDNLILSRWRRWSQDKRTAVLLEALGLKSQEADDEEDHDDPLDVGSDRQSGYSIKNLLRMLPIAREGQIWRSPLASWFEVKTFANDRMKLLSLLHVRTEYDSSQWAAFDTMQSRDNMLSHGSWITFNAGAVIMCGSDYGAFTRFNADAAHSWAVVGFLRAMLTFRAQASIAAMLRDTIDLIIADAGPSGNNKWQSLVSTGFRSALEDGNWSS